jgi:hypothetical protein
MLLVRSFNLLNNASEDTDRLPGSVRSEHDINLIYVCSCISVLENITDKPK